MILNLPDPQQLNVEDCFVWAGFVKPGRHTIVVKGTNGVFYRRTIAVDLRKNELPIFT